MTKLAELGRMVAREQDAVRARRPRDERTVERFAQRIQRRARLRPFPVALVAALAVAAAIALWLGKRLPGASQSATVGQHLVARNGQPIPLNFPDGSRVVLTSGSEAVVNTLSATGARLELSRGVATIAVRHQEQTNWLLDAGPYHVRVTGTRFSLTWQPEQEHFELRLEQGTVVVTADSGSPGTVTMKAPETLVIDSHGWQLTPPLEPAGSAAATILPEPPDSAIAPASSLPSHVPAQAPVLPSWEELVRAGKYAAAYNEASRRGIGELASTRQSSPLLSLAEVCRFSGHVTEAAQVLSRLRARFPGTDDAATAAFQLGRFANDTSAATWFRTYLQERPNGALAREASGRLLEVLSRSGDTAGATQAAQAYLANYPAGPHAAFARQLLRK